MWAHFYKGLPRSEKSQGKTKIFQGQGKVRQFHKSRNFFDVVKVSEKVRESVSEVKFLPTKSSERRKEVLKNEEKNINGLQKKTEHI